MAANDETKNFEIQEHSEAPKEKASGNSSALNELVYSEWKRNQSKDNKIYKKKISDRDGLIQRRQFSVRLFSACELLIRHNRCLCCITVGCKEERV